MLCYLLEVLDSFILMARIFLDSISCNLDICQIDLFFKLFCGSISLKYNAGGVPERERGPN